MMMHKKRPCPRGAPRFGDSMAQVWSLSALEDSPSRVTEYPMCKIWEPMWWGLRDQRLVR